MAVIYCYVLLMSSVFGLGYCGCRRADWSKSFDQEGLSKCDGSYEYITGFFRGGSSSMKDDPLYLLEEAECCTRPSQWARSKTQVQYADWWSLLDNNNRWGLCPTGYFLKGLYRTSKHSGELHNIDQGRCSKPADHPNDYGHCYNHDIKTCFDKAGLCKCNPGYYVTGIYRGGCDELNCLDMLRCCKMRDKPETLDGLSKVKTRIMDTTMHDIARLADHLGYGYCSGCNSPYVGEDFQRKGDTWMAQKSVRCDGYKSDQRLSMVYGDWSFAIKDIKYGRAIHQTLRPETVDSGTVENHSSTKTTQTITRTETSVRSVTHTVTSSWKKAEELGLTFSYSPPDAIGGISSSQSYKSTYENSKTNTDSTNTEQSNTLEVQSSNTLDPHTSVKWRLILSKTRTTVPYTATIIVKFSTELQGFMRWGGGPSGSTTNLHYQYRGSGKRPTVNYRFGNSNVPFYKALKEQSDRNSQPWLWVDMKTRHPGDQRLIDDLSNENHYVFTLTGKFEDIVGKSADVIWEPAQKTSGRKRSEEGKDTEGQVKYLKQVAEAGPDDPPAPNPDPPIVDI